MAPSDTTSTSAKLASAARAGLRPRLTLDNFGPLANGHVELRDLTVLVGPNGSGKSTIALVWKALVEALRHQTQVSATDLLATNIAAPGEVVAAVRVALEAGDGLIVPGEAGAQVDGTHPSLTRLRTALGRHAWQRLHEACRETIPATLGQRDFDAMARRGAHANMSVRFDFEHGLSTMEPTGPGVYSTIETVAVLGVEQLVGAFAAMRFTLGRETHRLGPEDAEKLAPVMCRVADVAAAQTWLAAFGDPAVYLPAGRTGLRQARLAVINSALAAATRPSAATVPSRLLRPLPTPVADMLRLFDSYDVATTGPHARLADLLEHDVLGGKIIPVKKPVSAADFMYKVGATSVPLESAHTAVSELADLVLVLRHVLPDQGFVFIEEPEAHIHPEAQRSVARVLAAMASSGIGVFVTTHSEILVDEVCNVMSETLLSQADVKKPVDYALQPEQVGIYALEGDASRGFATRRIDVDPVHGATVGSFNKVHHDLYRTRFQLERQLERKRA